MIASLGTMLISNCRHRFIDGAARLLIESSQNRTSNDIRWHVVLLNVQIWEFDIDKIHDAILRSSSRAGSIGKFF